MGKEMQQITVTYKYLDSPEFRDWFRDEVNSRICAVKANQNKVVQVTGWGEGDAIAYLQNSQAVIDELVDALDYVMRYNDGLPMKSIGIGRQALTKTEEL